MKRILFCACAAMFALAAPARCEFVVTFDQVGADVVAVGSGSLNVTDLTLEEYPTLTLSGVLPSQADLSLSSHAVGLASLYDGISGPASFGDGGFTLASGFSGDDVGVSGSKSFVAVPYGYISGSPLSAALIFTDTTFEELGLKHGRYVWTWGTGENADSFVVDATTPEPSSFVLLATALGFFVIRRLFCV